MESKGLKILIHASTWFAPILVPLIIFLITKEDDVKRLSIQAIIFHLLMTGLISLSIILSATIILAIIGIPLFIGFFLITLIVPIMGIVNAVQDRYFEYPIIGSFIK